MLFQKVDLLKDHVDTKSFFWIYRESINLLQKWNNL